MAWRRTVALSALIVALAACQQDEEEAPTPEAPVAPSSGVGPQAPVSAGVSKPEATRFLVQASFGPDAATVEAVAEDGPAAWIADQAALPHRAWTDRLGALSERKREFLSDLFWEQAVEGDDQLRARVAYALSNMITVSMNASVFGRHPEAYAAHMDALQRHALGNYEDLVREVSLSPAMGMWLSHLGNRRADAETGVEPDENYAREVMQLFTIGLEELNPDGTGTGAETYTTEDVKGLAAVFTGLSWADTDFEYPYVRSYNRTLPMESFLAFHEDAPKTFLGATIDTGQDATVSVEAALDHLLSHDNLAPFVAKQLIQHLTTSNPSGPYVARVGAAFEAGRYEARGYGFGEGRRGDMLATVAAILLDPEARPASAAMPPEHGRLREPVLRFTHLARAFRDAGGSGFAGQPPNAGAMRYATDLDKLGQAPMQAPSVFGWYRPGYVSPGGWTAERGLVAPEMQIATSAALAGYVDWMARTVRGDVWGTEFFDLDTSALEALAHDPDALIDEIDGLLTATAMQPATRARITEALDLVVIAESNEAARRRDRTRLALLMAVTAPSYAISR